MNALASRLARAAVPALVLATACLVGPRPQPLAAQAAPVDPALYGDVRLRMVGPWRGGRSTAVHGHPDRPFTFWMGTTGGGVWKSTNAGTSWENVSDGWFGGGIGDVTVAPSDPDVVYVGEGSQAIRGNISIGRGMWRSEDGGATWESLGLRDAGQIGRILVHPRDPDVVWVAALGNPFAKNPERGVFGSVDGGRTWEKALFLNDSTGVVDLSMHPERPDAVIAAAWRAERKPWDIISGATWNDGAGLWRTRDGGATWEHLSQGLPSGEALVGKVAVEHSPADPDLVWAVVEAERPDDAIYRSDDGGDTWARIPVDPQVLDHPYYQTYVTPHPTDPEVLYIPDEELWVSRDGGRSFEIVPLPHGDVHDLWIDPERPEVMVVADDGGGQVTLDGGASWTTYYNHPTAEFYRLEVDGHWPYRLYGAQQDNSTIRVPSLRLEGVSREAAWTPVGGGESGHIAVQRLDPDVVWAGSYGGLITRKHMASGLERNVQAYPEHRLGMAARDMTYRIQWNAPIEVDAHDPERVYHGAQVLLATTDGGRSWTEASEDLTYDDESKQRMPGRPITGDATGPEIYGTIFSITSSPHEAGTVWVGTDDGRVWITRDGAAPGNWTEITPEGLPRFSTVNAIELSPHRPGKAYVTAYRYRQGDFAPYVFRTTDHGATWTRIADGTRGIPVDDFARVVREDTEREGLLFAGTETGLYVSFDDGGAWRTLLAATEGAVEGRLPRTPVTDLKVHRGDLVVATQGRSFWILDDLSPLRQAAAEVEASRVHLYRPRPAHRWQFGRFRTGRPGEAFPANPPEGAILDYWLGEDAGGPVRLDILDGAGEVVRAFSSETDGGLGTGRGHHRLSWDLMHAGVELPEGVVLPRTYAGGFRAPPGTYRVRLVAGADTAVRELEVRIPPPYRGEVTEEELAELAAFARSVRDTLQSAVDRLAELEAARERTESARDRLRAAGRAELAGRAEALVERLGALAAEVHQPELRAKNDAFQYPPKLDAQIANLYDAVVGTEAAPTAGARRRRADLLGEWAELRARIQEMLGNEVPAFEAAVREAGLEVAGAGAPDEGPP